MTRSTTSLCIIGGGIAGLTLAPCLQKTGLRARICEAYQEDAIRGGGLQVAPTGMKVLAALDLADELRLRSATSSRIRLRNHASKLLADVTSRRDDGQAAVNAARATLHDVLRRDLERRHLAIEFGKRLDRVTDLDQRPIYHGTDRRASKLIW